MRIGSLSDVRRKAPSRSPFVPSPTSAAAVLLPLNARMAIVGDSIYSTTYRPSYYSGVVERGVAYIPSGGNKGIPGQTVASRGTGNGLVEVFASQVDSLSGIKIVEGNGGVNDIILGSIPEATTIAAWASVIQMAKARGLRFSISPILPTSGTYAFNTAQETMRQNINASLAAAVAADPVNLALVDISGFNPATMTLEPGLHPNEAGSLWYAARRRAALLKLMSDGDILSITSSDPANLVTNGFMTGTTGTKNNGALGTVATGWTADAFSSGTGPVMTMSKVARSDGFGEWQQIAVSGNSPSDGSAYTANFTRSFQNLVANQPAGTVFEIVYEFEQDGPVLGFYGHEVSGTLTQPGFAGGAGTIGSSSPQTTNNSTDQPNAFTGARRSVPGPASTAVTGIITVTFKLGFKALGAGVPIAATLRIGRVGLRVVSAP